MKSLVLVDSGIGGLSLVKIIQKERPDLTLHYIADEKYMPYGSKDQKFIIERGKTFAKYFDKVASTYVIACNTLSMCGYQEIDEVFSGNVIDIINPTCKYISSIENIKKVGVLATKNTVLSNAYKNAIKKYNDGIEVIEQEANAYVALAEHPLWFNESEKRQIIENRVFEFVKNNVSSIILGCTHFPSLIDDIRKAFPYEVDIFSSSELGAYETIKRVENETKKGEGKLFIYTTGDTEIIKTLINKWYNDLKISEIQKINI